MYICSLQINVRIFPYLDKSFDDQQKAIEHLPLTLLNFASSCIVATLLSLNAL